MLGEAARVLRSKRVLIAGGAGFIGSALCRSLVEMNADVTVLDAMIPEFGGNSFNLNGIQ